MLLLDSQEPPCKALEFRNGKHWCGLALNPERYNPSIASMSNSEIEKTKEWIAFYVGIGFGAKNCKSHTIV
jgi:hypothetical protein